ncbi:MAG: tetratricopeptide repeat protein [Armatimonadetes bacterium]|nr:tetratricopeptide repeat protein [Armatimonadota bacterium]
MKSHHKNAVRPGGRAKATNADALVAAGLAKHQAGNVAAALELYQKALQSEPGHADALCLTGAALIQQGQFDEAIDYLERATQSNAKHVSAWTNLGTAWQSMGHATQAMASFDRAIQIDGQSMDALFNRGNLLQSTGDKPAAAAAYITLLAHYPSHAEALTNLAGIQYDLRDYYACMGYAQRAIKAKPKNAKALNVYGLALAAMGNSNEAAETFLAAVRADPSYSPGYSNLAQAYLTTGRPSAALEASIHAVGLDPQSAPAHCCRADSLRELGQLDEAVAACKRALELDARLPEAHNCLGNIHLDLGQPEQADRSFRRALELDPTYQEIASNIVMAAQYDPGRGPGDVLAEALGFAPLFKAGTEPLRLHKRSGLARIGFVGGDLCNHPVGRFVEPLLSALAPSGIEAFVYSNTGNEDKTTERLRPHCKQWRRILGVEATRVADLVREDQIDVLVDLSGHTSGNRLDVFALHPAPQQATWLGFSGTVGLPEMDFLVGDSHVTPECDDQFYSENVLRLGSPWLCFAPPTEIAAMPGRPPHEKGQPFTFGCLNHSKKVNQQVVAAWAEILKQVPGSRIVLKSKAYNSQAARRQYTRWFEESGVSMEQVVFLGQTSWAAHFVVHNQIDVLLDPYPYNGATTTVEGLWMGVPVVTLESPGFVSRMSAAILRHIGHEELVAATSADYIAKAVELAGDVSRLAQYRAGLRDTLVSSPLCDAPRFAEAFVEGLRSA